MINQKQLAHSPNKSEIVKIEKTQRINEIKKSIIVAMERTQSENIEITATAQDIFSMFRNHKPATIRNAIRNGSLGKYGVNYKLTTQVIGSWVFKHLKEIQ